MYFDLSKSTNQIAEPGNFIKLESIPLAEAFQPSVRRCSRDFRNRKVLRSSLPSMNFVMFIGRSKPQSIYESVEMKFIQIGVG